MSLFTHIEVYDNVRIYSNYSIKVHAKLSNITNISNGSLNRTGNRERYDWYIHLLSADSLSYFTLYSILSKFEIFISTVI